MYSIDYQYRDYHKLTVHSKEYLESTDDDIQLWYHAKIAKDELEALSNGYDPEDKDLSGEELQNKYQGKVLEEKKNVFKKLTVEEQQDAIYESLSGEKTESSKIRKESSAHVIIITAVRHYILVLKNIDKYDKWVENTKCPFKIFVKLPLEEKTKYHNAMVAFHDKCVEEIKGQTSPSDQALDSSPGPDDQGGVCPNFDDKNKWEEIKDDPV